jgi:hypothetical protein
MQPFDVVQIDNHSEDRFGSFATVLRRQDHLRFCPVICQLRARRTGGPRHEVPVHAQNSETLGKPRDFARQGLECSVEIIGQPDLGRHELDRERRSCGLGALSMDRVRLKTEIEQHAHFDRAPNDLGGKFELLLAQGVQGARRT